MSYVIGLLKLFHSLIFYHFHPKLKLAENRHHVIMLKGIKLSTWKKEKSES